MAGTQIAKRYAKALLSLAKEQDQTETVGAELQQIAEALGNEDVNKMLERARLPIEVQKGIIRTIVLKATPHKLVENFLYVLTDNNRISELGPINASYQTLLDQMLSRVRAHIRSAAELTTEQRARLTNTFSELTNKTVEPFFETDEEILGGVIVEIEGRVYDASLKTRLRRLGDQLSEER